jgi:protein-L-isoaspartate(D-aspartate) O-methyltransferase
MLKRSHMEEAQKNLIQALQAHGIKNQAVLNTIEKIPRELFVPPEWVAFAYQDSPLSIGHGQTISQPYIVAHMTELALEKKPQKILEIGTGSGYQTAILAQLIPYVYSVERINALLDQAKKRLASLNLPAKIKFICADGSQGWKQYAPFDAIIVTATAPSVPENLLSQLSNGGRLVIPVEDGGSQFLYVIDKTEEGYKEQRLEAVRFVPLVSGETAD